jgi:hypothetical protein
MVPGTTRLFPGRYQRVQVGYFVEAHGGFYFVEYHDCRCASQAQWDASMEHAIRPRLALDYCRYLGRSTMYGTCPLYLTWSVHWVDSSCFTIQALIFLNINGEAIWTNIECCYLYVKSHLQMLGIWFVVLHACIYCR